MQHENWKIVGPHALSRHWLERPTRVNRREREEEKIDSHLTEFIKVSVDRTEEQKSCSSTWGDVEVYWRRMSSGSCKSVFKSGMEV